MQTGDAGRINFGNPYPIDLKSKRSEAPPDRTIPVEIFQLDPGNADKQGLLHCKMLKVGNYNVKNFFQPVESKPAEPQAAPSQDLPKASQTRGTGSLDNETTVEGNMHDWMVSDPNIAVWSQIRQKPAGQKDSSLEELLLAYHIPAEQSFSHRQTADVKGGAAASEIANHEIGHQLLESLGKQPSDHPPIAICFELKDPKPLRASQE